ncbi:MAG: nicotinate phosphoribosyltransferase [Deltaproteobacteria bacterium]|nr:nicotinate phosphoribosyltransferase [Deltaproteobacteria bacterium]
MDDPAPTRWVDDDNVALLTDLYELTMAQAYWAEHMNEQAVFSLFFRRLPARRCFALACGLDDVLAALEGLRFSRRSLDALARLALFHDDFLRHLEDVHFTGSVRALSEGSVVFADEPLLEISAPLLEAQLVESFVINQVHMQTVLASKAARVVLAAAGRRVVDFGMRRIHGSDAALKGARAFFVAGVHATSNVLAATAYGIPAAGTMAHSYVQAHASERAAFEAFLSLYPAATLLVDTYDTQRGVAIVVELAADPRFRSRIRALRLDSGDLLALSLDARRTLDAAGLTDIEIFASGGLDEDRVAALVAAGAPIDGFGVGTAMGVSDDAPLLDMAYKLVEYAGVGCLKTSPGKQTLPGPKQVFRTERDGVFERDVIATPDESMPGRPLLQTVMAQGVRTAAGRGSLVEARERARVEIARLPARLRGLGPAAAYPVEISASLEGARRQAVARALRASAPAVADVESHERGEHGSPAPGGR